MLLVPLVDPLGWSPVNSVLGKSGFEWMFGPTMMSIFVLASLAVCVWTAFRQLRVPPSPHRPPRWRPRRDGARRPVPGPRRPAGALALTDPVRTDERCR